MVHKITLGLEKDQSSLEQNIPSKTLGYCYLLDIIRNEIFTFRAFSLFI